MEIHERVKAAGVDFKAEARRSRVQILRALPAGRMRPDASTAGAIRLACYVTRRDRRRRRAPARLLRNRRPDPLHRAGLATRPRTSLLSAPSPPAPPPLPSPQPP